MSSMLSISSQANNIISHDLHPLQHHDIEVDDMDEDDLLPQHDDMKEEDDIHEEDEDEDYLHIYEELNWQNILSNESSDDEYSWEKRLNQQTMSEISSHHSLNHELSSLSSLSSHDFNHLEEDQDIHMNSPKKYKSNTSSYMNKYKNEYMKYYPHVKTLNDLNDLDDLDDDDMEIDIIKNENISANHIDYDMIDDEITSKDINIIKNNDKSIRTDDNHDCNRRKSMKPLDVSLWCLSCALDGLIGEKSHPGCCMYTR